MTQQSDETERQKISAESTAKAGTELQGDPSLSKSSSESPAGNWFHQHIAHEELRTALGRFGFSQPTSVQEHAIPPAVAGLDLVIQSKTGSGKTLAYLLPLYQRLLDEKVSSKQTYALIVSPTRELAVQIVDVASKLSPNVSAVCAIGGADLGQQVQALHRDARVVVGTPGRLLEMLRERHLKLSTCRYFVLDEADEMLSMGFLEDVRAILARLPDKRQGLFVSATITPRVDMLANSFLTRAQNIVIETQVQDIPTIDHYYCDVAGDLMAKPSALCDIIESSQPRSAIIFCNTKSDTRLVEAVLRRRGFDARRINSDLTQAQRDKIMKKIRAMELRFLVATDVAARGLDMEQIDLVVNYAIHEQPETYVHRTGRTGRAGRSGKAVSLIGPRDFGYFHHLTKVLDVNFQKMALPSEQDLASARLNHLYELLRGIPLEPRPQDINVVREMFRETGSEGTLSEEFELIMAKLCRHIVEHAIAEETKSLDEELDADRAAEAKRSEEDEHRGNRKRGGRDRRERSDSRRDDNRGERSSRERRPEERDSAERNATAKDTTEGTPETRRQESRAKDSKPQGDRHQNNPRQEERNNQDRPARNSADATHAGAEGDRGRPRERGTSDRRYGPEDTVRIFIGRGTEHGMHEKEFRALVTEFAELDEERLKYLSLRENYGYVDVLGRDVSGLMNNLNGIEYHGSPLELEIATVYPRREPRGDGPRDNRQGRGQHQDQRGRGGRDRRHDERRR